MKYDAILYDFDGTLVDSIPMIVDCFHIAYEEVLGIKKEDEEIKKTIGLPLWMAFQEYDKATQEALHAAYKRANEKILETGIKVFSGVDAMLETVRRAGIPQGVVTSKRKKSALFTMKQFKMDLYFDVFISREDTIEHKPNPAPLLLAAEQLGIPDMARIIYVGDSVHDIKCAHAAGASSVAVGWSRMPKDDLKALSPTFWLEQPDQISCILSDGTL